MNKGVITAWSAAEDVALRRMWVDEGQSGSICAAALGRSRNSIIGRVNRMGWSRGAASKPSVHKPYPKRAAQFRRRGQPAPAFVSPKWKDSGSLPPTPAPTRGANIESPNAGPWIARTARQCAFPVGDATGADQWSCCNVTEGGATYCPGHAAIMFNGTPKPNTAYVERKPRHQPGFKEWAA